jgi:hypothetical protein
MRLMLFWLAYTSKGLRPDRNAVMMEYWKDEVTRLEYCTAGLMIIADIFKTI